MTHPHHQRRSGRPRRSSAPRLATTVTVMVALLVSLSAVSAGHGRAGRSAKQGAGASPVPSGPPAVTVARVSTDARVIALTFDDGWEAARCLAIASVLDRYAVPATFFPNGVYVRRNPLVWASIGARFPIGNHTTHHPDLRELSDEEITRELERNRRTIEGITRRPMAPLLRPPYGAFDARVARVAGGLGYGHIVLWDTSDGDTGAHATERGSAKAGLRGGPGSIVLMHCGPWLTPKILPVIIERYACRGFRFATVEELLAGSPGHRARVECPPLPLPEKLRARRSPAPGPDESAMPTGIGGPPGMGEPPAASPTTPLIDGDVPGVLTRFLEAVRASFDRIRDVVDREARAPGPVAAPSGSPPPAA